MANQSQGNHALVESRRMLNYVCWQFRGGGNQQDPQVPAPVPPPSFPPSDLAERRPTETRKETLPQATSNRKLSRVEATEKQQGDPLTRNRRKDGFAPPWAADCVPLRIQHWVFETAMMISTRIEGRSGLGPTSTAAARDRYPKSTRWQPPCIHPKLDNHGSIERWLDIPPFKPIGRSSASRERFPGKV